ncbi:hypothetical protein HIM_05207 [Hirsutella minnesotensis 3608]|uniref:Bys1 family protein n=1 Tax=Hirsutella minnesotensis 3608 TaxID=1043627 RepID=A0A0F7ZKI6_9HYPO|nr:hypothetical protein HIM_05207 [Hirsutella minnesotensis 3608]
MHISLNAIAASAALAGIASAVGSARVVNKCPFQVTTWSVGSTISNPTTLVTGGVYSEPFTQDPRSGGRAIKITIDRDGLYTGKPQTIFAYNLLDGRVWYDLTSVFGNALEGYRVVAKSRDVACEAIAWEDGISPAGSQVKNCQDRSDVTLTLCEQ